MNNYTNIILNNRFSEWQQFMIYTKQYGDISIYQCISLLINEGIIPFLTKNGYNLARSKEDFTNGIATILFYLYYDKYYYSKITLDDFDDEFYEYFIEYTDWNILWKTWDHHLDDFLQYNTSSNCIQLQDYIYGSLDFDTSPTYLQYIEDNYEPEEELPKKKKEEIDPYLLENYHHKFIKFDI